MIMKTHQLAMFRRTTTPYIQDRENETLCKHPVVNLPYITTTAKRKSMSCMHRLKEILHKNLINVH